MFSSVNEAEATRKPAAAEIVKNSGRRLQNKAVEATLSEFPHVGPDLARNFSELLATITEGRIMRSAQADPQSAEHILALYRALMAYLLSERS